MTSVASIYLAADKKDPVSYNYETSSKTMNTLSGALKKASIQNFDLKTFSKNLTIEASSEFAQRYAVGALTKIINGEPVTNKTMLDSLFNTYATALNLSLVKSGYNNLMEMKDAVAHGTINPSNFLSGLSMGLQTLQNDKVTYNYKDKYGEEIPIDVVEKCEYEYKAVAPEHANSPDENDTSYISNMQRVVIKLFGHIKNKNAEIWEMNDFSYKIADAMAAKKLVALRIGRSIYEKVIIVDYKPVITNIYDIKFEMHLYMKYKESQTSKPSKENEKVRIIPNNLDQSLKNKTSKCVYSGSLPVEKVTKKDTILIAQMKKFLGKDKILVDGEYV